MSFAEGLEKALCSCPRCRKIGSLSTEGDEIKCSCGFVARFTETGLLEAEEKIPSLAEWEALDEEAIAAAGTVNTLLWGFNFIIGSALAILLRVILEKLREKGARRPYQDNYLLGRLTGAFFDIMIVAGIASINTEDIRGLVLPFVLMVAAGTVVTWFHLKWVCKAVYPDYYYEGLISMYGMMTGTISSGVLLLREIDPELETPAARSPAMCYATLGLAAIYLLVMDIIIFKVGRKKP